MLETIDVETAAKPNAAIIWLHGLGADGHDFEPVVPQLLQGLKKSWRFVFPHAPVRPVTINGGMRMRAWFDVKGFDRSSAQDFAGFKDSDTLVRELIARENGRGIPTQQIVLAGFSQGGAVSLYMVPRLADKLAGVMALSCYMPGEATFAAERQTANDATPLFMAHGDADAVLPLALGATSRDYLRSKGYTVEWHQYPMAHSVSPAELLDIRQYLLRVLP